MTAEVWGPQFQRLEPRMWDLRPPAANSSDVPGKTLLSHPWVHVTPGTVLCTELCCLRDEVRCIFIGCDLNWRRLLCTVNIYNLLYIMMF